MHCEPLLYCPTGRAGLGLQLSQQAGFEAVRFICCRADIVYLLLIPSLEGAGPLSTMTVLGAFQ